MFKSLILELAGNGTCYTDKINTFKDEDYCKNNDEFNKIIESLLKDIPQPEKDEILWNLHMAYGGMEAVTADEYFKEGFKLGLILGAQNFLDY